MLRRYDGKTFLTSWRRGFDDYKQAASEVSEIIAAVRNRGDEAVLAYTGRFDGARLDRLCVSGTELDEALAQVNPEALSALRQAAQNITAFHSLQLRDSWFDRTDDGVVLGQLVRPLARVGAYIPGGGAAYPSSVLMTVIPARVAGVREIVLVTPPRVDGTVNPYTLAAAQIAGAGKVFKCGGAQAVAALAYGTETIPKVDKIVGPGNIYVTLAKREVAGNTGIDTLAGPSEVLILADDSARAEFVAADLLAQAEHDVLASACCVTTSARLANELGTELERQCSKLARREVARKALSGQGALVLVDSLDEGMAIVNELAPEHLELHLADPWNWLDRIENAGAVFVGEYTPEAVGDYWAGPNHVLPTAGAARFSSPLSVDDFIKKSSVLCYQPAALCKSAQAIELLAEIEGLEAHSLSVKVRRKQLEKENS